jgi:hypothetical protein
LTGPDEDPCPSCKTAASFGRASQQAQIFSFTLTVWHDPAECVGQRWGAHVYLSAADKPTPQGGRRLFTGRGDWPAAAVKAAVEQAFRSMEIDLD